MAMHERWETGGTRLISRVVSAIDMVTSGTGRTNEDSQQLSSV